MRVACLLSGLKGMREPQMFLSYTDDACEGSCCVDCVNSCVDGVALCWTALDNLTSAETLKDTLHDDSSTKEARW